MHVEVTTTLIFFNTNGYLHMRELVLPLPDNAIVTGFAREQDFFWSSISAM